MILLEKAFELFDNNNKRDPRVIEWEGRFYPEEYFYALQLHNWILRLNPDASEPLLLASRCQHIGRWEISRSTYPEGKAGYLKWRTDLAAYHAETAARLLLQAGYEETAIEKVKSIIKKENLRTDSDAQAMEDALCLVFLQFQFEEFIKGHDDDKVVRIVQKTWRKMSEKGRVVALSLDLNGRAKILVEKALV